MSLKSILISIGKELINVIARNEQKIERYKDKNRDLDDEKLAWKYEHSSSEEKLACGLLIKERRNKQGK